MSPAAADRYHADDGAKESPRADRYFDRRQRDDVTSARRTVPEITRIIADAAAPRYYAHAHARCLHAEIPLMLSRTEALRCKGAVSEFNPFTR